MAYRGKRQTTYEQFCDLIAQHESGRKEVDIAQIKEQLMITRRLIRRTGVDIYKLVESTPLELFQGVKI